MRSTRDGRTVRLATKVRVGEQTTGLRSTAAVATNADVRATRFEFEKRFWIICAIYFAGFCLPTFDHTPFIAALRHLIAPGLMPGSAEAERFARRNSIWFSACFSCGSAANLGRGLFADGDRARYKPAFRSAGGRRTFSLHAKSALSRQSPNGGGNRRPGKPIRIYFPGAGKLDFCLPADFARGRIPAENSRGVVSSVLPGGTALLARAKAAGSCRKSSAALAAGIRRRKFCLDIWGGRIAGRDHAAATGSIDRISTGISGAFCDYPLDSKAPNQL
jgi:hypothetical protein